jgi:O-antigen/teichoic acid export membrane protein
VSSALSSTLNGADTGNADARYRRLKNFFVLAGSQVIIFGTGLVAGVYARRVLGASAIGQFAWCASVVSYFSLIVNPGLDTIAQRDVARDPSKGGGYASKLFSLKLVLALGAFLLLLGLARVQWRTPGTSGLLVLQAVGILLLPVSLNWLLLARERVGVQALTVAVVQVLQLPALMLLVNSPADLRAYVIYTYPFTAGTAVYFFWYVRQQGLLQWHGLRLTLRGSIQLLREAVPVGLSQFATLLYFNADAIMLGIFRDDTTVGYYSTAYRLWSYAILPFSALSQAFFPSFARESDDARTQQEVAEDYTRIVLWFGLPICALCWASGRFIVTWLYGWRFAESGPLFEWLSLNIALSSFTWSMVMPLNAWGKQRTTLRITVTAALVNLGLNCWFIPRYGAAGAIVTTLLAEAVALGVGLMARSRTHPLKWWKLLWKPAITSLAVAITVSAAIWIWPSAPGLAFALGVTVAGLGLVVLERQSIISLVNRCGDR